MIHETFFIIFSFYVISYGIVEFSQGKIKGAILDFKTIQIIF
jgi:hypothetical protein